MKRSKLNAVLTAIAAAVVVIDQLIKYLAREHLDGGVLTLIPGFLQVQLHMNDGASLGILGGARWLLVAVSVVMSLVVIWAAFFTKNFSAKERVCLAFVLGGAVGNLVDRAASGLVTDMLYFPWISKIPLLPDFVCNVADIAIVFGVAAFLIFFIIEDRKRTAAKKSTEAKDAEAR